MNRLKELRKANNLKSKELAETIGVSYQTLHRWENGDSIKAVHAVRLSEILGVNVSYLLGFTDEQISEKDDSSLFSNRQQYILKITNIEISLLRDSEKISAQDLSDIKKVARGLYENLVCMQYEAEEREGE